MANIAVDISALTGATSGIPRYIAELVRALGRLKGDDRYLALHRGKPAGAPQFPGVEVVSAQMPLWLTVFVPYALLRRRCRVVHFPYAALPPWVPCRIVITVHDLAFIRNPNWFTPEMGRMLRETWLPAMRRADHIICISEFTRRELAGELGMPLERMTATPLGVGEEWLQPAPPGEHPNGGRPYVLAVGTVQPRKNYPRLIEAFARAGTELGDLDLCITGTPGWNVEDLPGIAARHGVGERVKLTGGVSDAELRNWYEHATALALPSYYEGFGLPLLEAMAVGVPCLTSNVSALPEAAGEAAVLVDPLDVDSITKGLLRVCRDEGLRAELRQKGLARAHQFTWERCARMTAEVYRGV